MRPSKLFGVNEMPSQKAYPSKDFDYFKNNPDQGVFELKQTLIRPKLSNGQEWNRYGQALPRNTIDKFPHLSLGETFKTSLAAGAYNSEVKATNPEIISTYGILPTYPEVQRVREMLDQTPKIRTEVATARETFGGFKLMEEPELKGRIKYSQEKIDRLVKLGFSEELIGKAIEEEAKRDLIKVLNNPSLLQESKIAEEIQAAYNRYIKSTVKTGENAEGIGGASGVQNAGVRAYAAAAAAADENVMGASLPAKVAAKLKMRAEASKYEHHDAADVARELESRLPSTAMAGAAAAAAASYEDDGEYGAIGGGPGGSATSGSLFASRAIAEVAPAAAAAAGGGGGISGRQAIAIEAKEKALREAVLTKDKKKIATAKHNYKQALVNAGFSDPQAMADSYLRDLQSSIAV